MMWELRAGCVASHYEATTEDYYDHAVLIFLSAGPLHLAQDVSQLLTLQIKSAVSARLSG